VARPIDEPREPASIGAAARSRGEISTDPAEALYRLGVRQADPGSGIRDYRAARATFTELLIQYPHSRRDAEARAWQATLTDLLVREDDARRALLRLRRSEEDGKRTKTNLEWLRQNDLDQERRK
jgi:TolA-binding protein